MKRFGEIHEGRRMIQMVANSTQEQCREMGEMMISLSNSPRDHHWRMQMQKALAGFPAEPESDLAIAMESARKRIDAHDREMWATGWHPIQMREKLAEIGYTGTPAECEQHREPSTEELRAEREH